MRSSLRELESLTRTAGGAVAEALEQRLDRRVPGTLIGEGKVREVAEAARRHRARTVIFDEDLTAAQQKNLEAAIPAKILDRTRLILDIFSRRARTREGALQVELAQLSYLLPRLTGRWRAYSQQVGGIGTRGPGERQLEYERRHISRRIRHLKKDIERTKRERDVQRQKRRSIPVPQIAIVGYTNVGKSTLLNALTREGAVYADDKLFATLDPTTRRARLPGGGWAVFTDTVGFIQRLPTALVAAFRSTLEEAALADCLIHVMDATAEDPDAQKKAVEDVLRELHADKIPRIEAVNKTDRLTRPELRALREKRPEAVFVSASRKTGLEALLGRVEEALSGRWVLRELDMEPGDGALLGLAYQCAQVLSQTPVDGEPGRDEGRLRLKLRVTPENWARLRAIARDLLH